MWISVAFGNTWEMMKQNAIHDAWIIFEDKNRLSIYSINHAIEIHPNEPKAVDIFKKSAKLMVCRRKF